MNATITLKDLSSLSGFSISTISKALNDKIDISKETRKTIRTIAKEHNYIPNNFAVALRKKTSKVIAVIIPQINNDLYSSFLYNIQKIASELEYRILFFQSFEEEEKEIKYLRSINDGSVDGVIIVSKSKNLNQHSYSVPIEMVKFSNAKNKETFKKEYIYGFKTLLKKVS